MFAKRTGHATIWAYKDGKKFIDVCEESDRRNVMVSTLKKQLVVENPGHRITFRVE